MSRDAARARSGASRTSLYDEITTKIIAELEAGRVPWVQPWGTAAAKAPLAMPKNASTRRFYSGINVLILWGSVIEHGFPVQGWLTFRQALGLGGNVRKGEHGTTVVYADRFIPDDERKRAQETDEEAQAIPFLKRFEIWPAMIARVTDLDGRITGAHRTWLDPDGFDAVRLGKAPIDTPRRAMGDLLGHAVRFGVANDVLAAGEGVETILSLRCVLPSLPMAAALSANHLAAMLLPLTLRRLYIARDADAAGDAAVTALTERADAAGIEAIAWSPKLDDFNEDLRTFGIDDLRAALRTQLAPQDVVRFLLWATAETG